MKRLGLFLLLAAVIFPTSLFAASAGAVRGKVLGPDNKPLAGVVVQLRNDITGFKQDAATTADGTFSFNNVPYNPYELHIDVQGFQPAHLQSMFTRRSPSSRPSLSKCRASPNRST